MSTLKDRISFRILKFLSILISFILGIFSNSCNKYGTETEYGMPHADFKINGTVKSDQSDTPIRGISMSLRSTSDNVIVTDSTLTDSLGRYSIEFTDGVSKNNTWILRANDVDGNENGVFSQKDSIVSIPENELSGGNGNWYMGKGEKEVNLGLEEGS